MKKYFLILLLSLFFYCDKKTTGFNVSENLSEEGSVWVFSHQDINNSKNVKTIRLVFEPNGFFYEENAKEKFPWSFNAEKNKLIIKDQEYDILRVQRFKIFLRNSRYRIEAKLNRDLD